MELGHMKKCSTCKQFKELSEFHKSKAGKLGVVTKCKSCLASTRRTNPHMKTDPTIMRGRWLKFAYGISPEDYKEMLDKQDGRCAICGIVPLFKPLAVDHCHETGRVRGLLCGNCNRGIGIFRDDSDLLKLAANYLDNHKL